MTIRKSSISGISTGPTAERPLNPQIGDVFYNGTLAILEIYDGTNWVPCSAPAATPTISVADVGTSVAYGSAQGAVTITEGTSGGPAELFLISSSTGGYTATTSETTVTITVGNNGSWTFSGQGINNFGTSVSGPTSTATLTTVPQAPTIGTATASTSANEITVTWTLGSNGGKDLSSITITPYLNGTTAETSRTAATTSSTSYTFTEGQLTAGSSYTFKVKTTNANGDSLESSASSSATMPDLVIVDFLVLAGGGGGGNDYYSAGRASGGGGAGGLRCSVTNTGGGGSLESALAVTRSTNYTVTVGSGGDGGATATNTQRGATGSNSVFSNITSNGGGGGGSHDTSQNYAASSGGCGGGGSNNNNGAAGTANQGFAGASNNNRNGSGGGGGTGTAGVAVTQDTYATAGGAGVASSITGSSVTYGGGGGGGGSSNWLNGAGNGGSGGGGSGIRDSVGHNGTANLGGGGGGGRNPGGRGGGNGGSGVVILRWPTASGTITVGAGLTADATGTDGSYSYKKFTAGSGNVSFS